MVIAKSKYKRRLKDISDARAVNEVFAAILKAECETDRDKEHFWSIGLTTRNNIKYIELVSLGTLHASLVHPREVFRMAITSAASSIILVHNHPSGDPQPSDEDLRITRRLIDAGKIIGIELLDHVVVGNDTNDYKSFKEGGLL